MCSVGAEASLEAAEVLKVGAGLQTFRRTRQTNCLAREGESAAFVAMAGCVCVCFWRQAQARRHGCPAFSQK